MLGTDFLEGFRAAKKNLEFLERLGELLKFKKELRTLAMEKVPSLSYWYEKSEEEVRNIVFMRFPGSIDGKGLVRGKDVYKEAAELTEKVIEISREDSKTQGEKAMDTVNIMWLEPAVAMKVRLYDYVTRANYGKSIHELYAMAKSGDMKSFWKLVRVDKTVIFTNWAGDLIWSKQYEADWEFFKKLGRAIAREPVQEPPNLMKAALLARHFWEDDLRHMKYREIRDLLCEEGLIGSEMDEHAVRKFLNRQGLRKHAKK